MRDRQPNLSGRVRGRDPGHNPGLNQHPMRQRMPFDAADVQLRGEDRGASVLQRLQVTDYGRRTGVQRSDFERVHRGDTNRDRVRGAVQPNRGDRGTDVLESGANLRFELLERVGDPDTNAGRMRRLRLIAPTSVEPLRSLTHCALRAAC